MGLAPDTTAPAFGLALSIPAEDPALARCKQAITDGDDGVQYYFGTRVVSDWQRGSAPEARLLGSRP